LQKTEKFRETGLTFVYSLTFEWSLPKVFRKSVKGLVIEVWWRGEGRGRVWPICCYKVSIFRGWQANGNLCDFQREPLSEGKPCIKQKPERFSRIPAHCI